jgi:hypothetical protein
MIFGLRDLEAGHGDIGRGDEAVMPAADDDDVRHRYLAQKVSINPNMVLKRD